MANGLEIISRGARQTQELGRRLGERAERGDLLLLTGALGSGKTTLAQGIAWGLGVQEYAHSPTFLLVHVYHGRLPLYHLDLYRLDDPREVEDLDLDEMLNDGVCAVEWAEKALPLFPQEHLLIEIMESGARQRRLLLTPVGRRHVELLAAVKAALPVR